MSVLEQVAHIFALNCGTKKTIIVSVSMCDVYSDIYNNIIQLIYIKLNYHEKNSRKAVLHRLHLSCKESNNKLNAFLYSFIPVNILGYIKELMHFSTFDDAHFPTSTIPVF